MKKYSSQSFPTLHLTDDISDTGDSGAWVVDAMTGDLYGVIVAASAVMQEGYLIPAREIKNDIQRATGVSTVELPKRAAFVHASQHLKETEGIDEPLTQEAVINYLDRLNDTLYRPGRTDHEPHLSDIMQKIRDLLQERSRLTVGVASHSQIARNIFAMIEPASIGRLLGKEHPPTLSSMINRALSLDIQGKYLEAEEMHRQTLALMERVLGKDHVASLSSINSRALNPNMQGSYDEAEEIHRRILAVRESTLGKEHQSTLSSMNNLAVILNRLGKYDEAEDMHRQTLASMERVLGKDHLATLWTTNNLALVLDNQGKYEEAEEINRKALASMERVLGKEQPSTLMSMNNLGLVLSKQGKYEEAEQMHRQALMLRKRVLDDTHPDTLKSVKRLVWVLRIQGKNKEAEEMVSDHLASVSPQLEEVEGEVGQMSGSCL